MRFFPVLIFVAILSACSQEMPPDVLKPEKMQGVYFDIIQADIYTKDYISKDTSRNVKMENAKLQAMIFKKHGVTARQYYTSYDYYVAHPEVMKDMVDSMIMRQTKKPDTTYKPPVKHNLKL